MGSFWQTGLITGVLNDPSGFGNPKNCRIRELTLLSTPEKAISAPDSSGLTTEDGFCANRTNYHSETRLFSGSSLTQGGLIRKNRSRFTVS